MAKHFNTVQYKLKLVTEFCDLWSKYFHFFADEQSAINDSPEMNEAFLRVTKALGLRHYQLSELLHEDFADSAEILKILSNNASLTQIKDMPDTEFDRMQVAWHEIFLKLNKTRGVLEHRLPPKRLEELREAQEQAQATSEQIPEQDAVAR